MTTDIEATAPAVTIQAPNPADRAKLFAALAKAQAAFKTVQKNRQANYGRYADLTSILEAVRPALNANGIFLYQDVRSVQGGVTVRTILAHESGQKLRALHAERRERQDQCSTGLRIRAHIRLPLLAVILPRHCRR